MLFIVFEKNHISFKISKLTYSHFSYDPIQLNFGIQVCLLSGHLMSSTVLKIFEF